VALNLDAERFGGAGDPLHGVQPILERALGRLDQNMFDARCAIGGQAGAECPVVLAVLAVA
jgi:hypothetical protein